MPVDTHASPDRPPWFAIALLALATLAAYADSLRGPFVYDDIPAIVANPTIRHLWPLRDVLMPALDGAVTTAGRPVLNLSFALSYAVSGDTPWGHHAVNILIHLGAALLLFGLVRRALRLSTSLAFAIAALWAVHPLQTQAVTYTVQRAESLMALFYLLVFYAFARGVEDAPRRQWWFALCVTASALGMATKEVMVTAPVLLLLFDRTFFAGSFREAWRERARLHLAVAATWLVLGALLLSTGGNRGGSIGFGVGVSWGDYVLTQFDAIARYLALSVWPHPLVFEYGTFWVQRVGDLLPAALLVLALAAGTAYALKKKPALGFAGAWFFGILAPTSLSPGTTQMIVEHRMYLPLAAVLAVLVLAARAWLRSGAIAIGAAVLACGGLTAARNHDYRSAIALWSDTLAKRPENNVRAHENLAGALIAAGRLAEGLAHYETAVQLTPDSAKSHYNLARALLQAGRAREAIPHFETAVRLAPSDANAHTNLALALASTGQVDTALAQAAEAARLAPGNAEIRYNHALLLQRAAHTTEAVPEYEAALRARPNYVEAHNNLGNALLQLGRLPEAIAHYEAALQLAPNSREARDNLVVASLALGRSLVQAGKPREAVAHYERAIRLDPQSATARYNLANALLALDDTAAAIASYEAAIRLRPDFVDAHVNLATTLRRVGRGDDALNHFEQAIRLAPDDVGAQLELGNTLAQLGRLPEAIAHYERALTLRPDLAAVREQLARLRAATAKPPP